LLVQPLGGRVHGRELVARPTLVGTHHAVLGVNHLEPRGPRSDLAEATHFRTACESLLLASIEMKKAERQRARPVGDPAEQRAPSSHDHLAELDLAFHEHALSDSQRANGRECAAILIALRQQAQEIANGAHTEVR
jgi:hypothetical protein